MVKIRTAPVHATLLSIILCMMLPVVSSTAQSREVSLIEQDNVISASYVDEPIVLNGILDEAGWQASAVISDFVQYEPVDGAPASQKTEVRVLYGANSLYIGAYMYDDDPMAIEKTLGRRDDFNRADWFMVSLDAYLDRQTRVCIHWRILPGNR